MAGRDDRSGILEFAYREVLDATKHQDDKVGRLLTLTAFLTAAVLALANLARDYIAEPALAYGKPAPPVGLVSLVAYLVFVSVALVFLLNSLYAPLRIPAFDMQESKRRRPDTASRIYFYDISRYSMREWELSWNRTDQELRKSLDNDLVFEVHNLAVRAEFKHARSTEGVALLQFSLLALLCLAVSASRGLVPLTTGQGNSEWGLLFRTLLGICVAGWTLVVLTMQFRSSLLAVDKFVEMSPLSAWLAGGRVDTFGATSRRAYTVFCVAAILLAIAVPLDSWSGVSGGMVARALLLLSSLTLCLSFFRPNGPSLADREDRARALLSFILSLTGCLTGAWLFGLGLSTMEYLHFLLGSACVPLSLVTTSILMQSALRADRMSAFTKRRDSPPNPLLRREFVDLIRLMVPKTWRRYSSVLVPTLLVGAIAFWFLFPPA